MKNSAFLGLAILSTAALATACGGNTSRHDDLVGAWRSQIRFGSGAFAQVKDLEFMYVFNAGGTLTESSNYDGAPPVPPAYGTWRRRAPHQFEATYAFYATRAPANLEDITSGGGWLPAGRGELTETITLSDDGRTYSSTISYAAFDAIGASADGHGEGTGAATRMGSVGI
jgi:hypothetical protein